jgi:hypothetical protein
VFQHTLESQTFDISYSIFWLFFNQMVLNKDTLPIILMKEFLNLIKIQRKFKMAKRFFVYSEIRRKNI